MQEASNVPYVLMKDTKENWDIVSEASLSLEALRDFHTKYSTQGDVIIEFHSDRGDDVRNRMIDVLSDSSDPWPEGHTPEKM